MKLNNGVKLTDIITARRSLGVGTALNKKDKSNSIDSIE